MKQMDRVLTLFYQWIKRQPRLAKWLEWIFKKLEHIISIPDLKSFVKSLGGLFVFNRLSSVLMMFIGIMTARILGPVEYGKIGLVGSVAGFLYIPILMGANNSMYKYLPECGAGQCQKLMNTALIGNILTAAFWGGIFFSAGPLAAKYFHIPPQIWQLGVGFTIILTFNTLTESFLRGQKKYTTIATIKFSSTAIFFLMILLLFLCLPNLKADFSTFYFCNISSQIFFIAWAIWRAGIRLTKFQISWPVVRQIYSLGTIVMVNMLLTAIINSSDIFIVNYFYPGRAVGLYNVYQGFVKNLFTVMFFEVFAVVFLPTIATMDKTVLYQKFNRYIYWFIPIITVITGIMTALTVLMFGKEYTLSLVYIVLVSLSIGLYSVFQMFNCIFSMEGNQGAKLCLIPLAVTVPCSLLLQFFLTKFWGITGMMIAVLLTNLMLVFIFKVVIAYRHKFTGLAAA